MTEPIQKCSDCHHKMNGVVSGAEYYHCRANPGNQFVGGQNLLDFKYCESVRQMFPICPDYTPKMSRGQRIKQFFTGTK